jgi:hypothetical protein
MNLDARVRRGPASLTLLGAPLALALLAGCTTVAPDGGFGQVAATAGERIGAAPGPRRRRRA